MNEFGNTASDKRSRDKSKLAFMVFRASAIILAAFAFTYAHSVSAQTIGTGSIQGTVTDTSGAVIANALVTATNPATGFIAQQSTSRTGSYNLVSLPPATYTISIEAKGFETFVRRGIAVDALAQVGLNASIKVGSQSETVEVSTAAQQINTSNGALQTTLPNSIYSALPLNMNDKPKAALGFVTLLPGATTDQGGPFNYELNGQVGYSSILYLNGMPVTTSEVQGDTRNIDYSTSVNAVDQFQIITSGIPAYYSGQGIINLVLKSGTNAFHGDVNESVRNTIFDAAGYFAAQKPVEHQNEFGGSLGGPILKNRLFFFVNYDGYRYVAGANPVYVSIPTVAERAGDFSALPVPIYDPATESCANNICTRQQFQYNGVLNVIPPNRISSISKSFQSFNLPQPINTSLQNNYLAAGNSGFTYNKYLGKVDYALTKNNRLLFVFEDGTHIQTEAPATLPFPYSSSPATDDDYMKIVQIVDTQVIRPNLINVAGYQMNRFVDATLNVTAAGNYATKAGLSGLPGGLASEEFPPIGFSGPNSPTGWANGSGLYLQLLEASTTNTFQDNLQGQFEKHNITIGAQAIVQDGNIGNPSQFQAVTFAANETEGFSSTGTPQTATGNSYASFLLGDVDSASLTDTTLATAGGRYRNYAVYAQDDWRLTPKLVVNLGLRYEIPKPYFEVKNRESFLNPNLPNPALGGYPGALEFAGDGPDSCHCRDIGVNTHYLTLAPRVGFAYNPVAGTVIRGSFTVIHYNGPAMGGGAESHDLGTGTLGYSANPTPSSPNGYDPAFNWNNGFPAYTHPPFFDPTLDTGYTTTIGATGGAPSGYLEPNQAGRSPYTENWNLTVEQQLTSVTALSLSYAGSASHLLNVPYGNADEMRPEYLALGNLLNANESPTTLAQAQGAFPGIKLPYSNFEGTIAQMLRPLPQYAYYIDLGYDYGNAIYHSMQAFLRHTSKNGLYFQAAYTWSKEIDDDHGSDAEGIGNGLARNPYNLNLDRSPSSSPFHVVSIAYSYALPFGRGHALGASGAAMNALVGGWTVSGTNSYSTGAPLGRIYGSGLTPGMGSFRGTADYTPSFSGAVRINGAWGSGNPKGGTRYINVGAFQNPASYTFGTAPESYAYHLVGPPSLNESVALAKTFGLWKSSLLRLQVDAFNVFNRTQFSVSSLNINSAAFGEVGGQSNSPRNLQFEASIHF